jgi:hypothetical protein
VPALEPLISKLCRSRAPVAPVYLERASRPLVGIRTLRGSVLFEPGARAAQGSSLLGKGPCYLMLAVAAAVRRCGRAFSGAAAAHVVGGVGRRTRRPAAALRLPRRDDGARAAAAVVVGPARQREKFSPAVNARGACAPESTPHGSINPIGGGETVFYLPHLAFAVFASCASAPELFLLSRLCSRAVLASHSSLLCPFAWLPRSPSPSLTRRHGSA